MDVNIATGIVNAKRKVSDRNKSPLLLSIGVQRDRKRLVFIIHINNRLTDRLRITKSRNKLNVEAISTGYTIAQSLPLKLCGRSPSAESGHRTAFQPFFLYLRFFLRFHLLEKVSPVTHFQYKSLLNFVYMHSTVVTERKRVMKSKQKLLICSIDRLIRRI